MRFDSFERQWRLIQDWSRLFQVYFVLTNNKHSKKLTVGGLLVTEPDVLAGPGGTFLGTRRQLQLVNVGLNVVDRLEDLDDDFLQAEGRGRGVGTGMVDGAVESSLKRQRRLRHVIRHFYKRPGLTTFTTLVFFVNQQSLVYNEQISRFLFSMRMHWLRMVTTNLVYNEYFVIFLGGSM